MILTGIGDEAAGGIDGQIKAHQQLGWKWIEMRGVEVPGEEGVHSVELANAMLYSSLNSQTVELPMDSAAFEKKLNELIKGSKIQKKVIAVSSEDFTKSFIR